ncbi:hypothetical protein [Bacteroides sp. AM10-21B]|uniref:hypothetical protein n=1 Tax=Bacteroides sp. AM10-21B TaxID=2292001 RepID=UPI0011C47721|nr:hypothetical protein [Bacteroides sp. AM10-21B]
MLSPLTQRTIALLHLIAHAEHCNIPHCGMSSHEELRHICALLEQKGMIRPATNTDAGIADTDTRIADPCIAYALCRPLHDISLLDVLQVTDGHLDCNKPTTEEFYSRYGKVAQKLGVVNYMTRLYLSEIRITDFC